jgi:hypothetical protein
MSNKKDDELLVVSVVQDVEYQSFGLSLTEVQRRINRDCKAMLRDYKKRARDAGCQHVTAVMGVAVHDVHSVFRGASILSFSS